MSVKCKIGSWTVISEMFVAGKNRSRKFCECRCDCGNVQTIRADGLYKIKCKCSKTNFTGMRFNKWLILEDKGRVLLNGKTISVFRCQCDCGTKKDMAATVVKSGDIKSCGCNTTKIKDVIGGKFNKLTIIKDNGVSASGRKRMCKCECECGNIVDVDFSKVISGHTKSCGCIKHNRPLKKRDMIGKKFTKLTVVKENGFIYRGKGKYKRRKIAWICKCDCGKEVSVAEDSLINKNTKSCGCIASESQIAVKFNDLSGKKFGRLQVNRMLRRVDRTILWECKCDCGAICEVRGCGLTSGGSQSCGCLCLELTTKHGMCKKDVPRKEYLKFRRKDPIIMLKHRVSCNVRHALVTAGYSKRGKKTFDYLPYTAQQLREHLESLWEPWMNWDNYGGHMNDKRRTWHIDHVVPQCQYRFKSLEDPDFLECWKLSNLRPMEKHANLKKGKKLLFS